MDETDLNHWTYKDYLWTFLIATVVAYLLLKYIRWRIWAARVDLIPGPFALPFIGNSLTVAANRTRVFKNIEERFEKYGPVFRIWFGTNAVIAINKAEFMEPLLNSTNNLRKSILYKFVIPWLGDGLLTTSGAKWHAHRKLITPTFHFKMLENFHDIFVAKSNILIDRLKSHCDSEKPFDIYPYITRATLDVICETAMDTNVNAQIGEQSEYVKSVYEISELIAYRGRRMWLYADFIFKSLASGKTYFKLLDVLHNFTINIIQKRKISRQKSISPKKRSITDDEIGIKNKTAFLDLLLKAAEDGEDIDERSIREEVDTFMFEGHDTTSSAISFCLYLLGLNIEHQERAAQEVISIVGKDQPITVQDINNMKYLDMVLKEAMRLYPPVPLIGRQLDEDLILDNYVIPAGSAVTLFIYFLHRDKRFFPDPEKFDPDRFLPDNVKGRYPYAYLPFSAGPRNCIGQKFALLEEKVVLATILRKYKIISVDKPDKITLLFEILLKAEKGIHIKLQKRD